MSDVPFGELADDDDQLDWSWDALTDGERTEDADEDLIYIALFAGVPDDDIEAHKAAIEELAR